MRKFFNYIFLIHFFLELNGQTPSNQLDKLNVVLFMVDDLKPNLGIYNDSFSISPNIDKLIRYSSNVEHTVENSIVVGSSPANGSVFLR